MADESKRIPRSAIADRLKAMFKAAEDWPVPGKIQDAAERLDGAADEAKEATPPRNKRRGST